MCPQIFPAAILYSAKDSHYQQESRRHRRESLTMFGPGEQIFQRHEVHDAFPWNLCFDCGSKGELHKSELLG
jgi:hypothetical protein